MKKRAFGGIAVALGSAFALAWSLPANAQQYLANPDVANGSGYHSGDFDIHPGIGAEIGYDSNYLQRSDKSDPRFVNAAPQAPPQGTGMLRISPSLRLSTAPTAGGAGEGGPPPERPPVSFNGGVTGTYREFFSSSLSSQRNMSGAADAVLGILPGRAWSGSINGSWTRLIQPTVLGNPDQSYNNDSISAGADLAAQPNEGTLDWHFGYEFTGIFFEQSSGTPYNTLTHNAYTRGRWKFRPRTALLYDGTISWRTFPNAGGAAFDEHSSTPLRVRFGMEGLITSRFSLLALVGYGASFATGAANDPSVQQYDSVIGQVELRFFPTTAKTELSAKPSLLVSTIALGYTRDFQASYTSASLGVDRGYLRAEYFFAGRFLITLEGGVGAYEHPNLYFAASQGLSPTGEPVLMANAYTDVRADATLFTEYRIIPSLGINATLGYSENFSSTQLPVTEADVASRAALYDMSWRRYQAFFGVRWFM